MTCIIRFNRILSALNCRIWGFVVYVNGRAPTLNCRIGGGGRY